MSHRRNSCDAEVLARLAGAARRLDGAQVIASIMRSSGQGDSAVGNGCGTREVSVSSRSSVPDTVLATEPEAPRLASLGWALRRTALWLLMLFAMVVVLGWLFYAGIDPDEASAGSSPSESSQPAQ